MIFAADAGEKFPAAPFQPHGQNAAAVPSLR